MRAGEDAQQPGAPVEEEMDEIRRLIEQLQSPNKSKRYNACEYLRVTPELPDAALGALRQAAGDPDPEVADAARRAFAVHTDEEIPVAPAVSAPISVGQRLWGITLISMGVLLLALGEVMYSNMEGTMRLADRAVGQNPQCSWSIVQGTVTSSDLHNYGDPLDEDDWQFTVGYTYKVGAYQYSDEQRFRDFRVSTTYGTPALAEERLFVEQLFKVCEDPLGREQAIALFQAAFDNTQFLPGQPVIVYVDPVYSDQAVLVPGLTFGMPMSDGEAIAPYAVCALPLAGIFLCFKGISKLLSKG